MRTKLALAVTICAILLIVQGANALTLRPKPTSSYNNLVRMFNSEDLIKRSLARKRLNDTIQSFLLYNILIEAKGEEKLICMDEVDEYGPDELMIILNEYMVDFGREEKVYDIFHPHLLGALTRKFPCN